MLIEKSAVGKLLKVGEIVHRMGFMPRCALFLQFPFS